MSDNEETHLLLYRYVENMSERRTPHREAHLARPPPPRAPHLDHVWPARAPGTLLIAGAYGDPVSGGAIAFKGVTREHVEHWVAEDPYNLNGLVISYEIHRWNLV
jgi:uncharacterized protein YciI